MAAKTKKRQRQKTTPRAILRRMADSEKWAVYRIYLTAEDSERLELISKLIELKPTETLSKIAHAGILSLKENGNRMPLPLRFQIEQHNGSKK